jgi:hypothetical protein
VTGVQTCALPISLACSYLPFFRLLGFKEEQTRIGRVVFENDAQETEVAYIRNDTGKLATYHGGDLFSTEELYMRLPPGGSPARVHLQITPHARKSATYTSGEVSRDLGESGKAIKELLGRALRHIAMEEGSIAVSENLTGGSLIFTNKKVLALPYQLKITLSAATKDYLRSVLEDLTIDLTKVEPYQTFPNLPSAENAFESNFPVMLISLAGAGEANCHVGGLGYFSSLGVMTSPNSIHSFEKFELSTNNSRLQLGFLSSSFKRMKFGEIVRLYITLLLTKKQ